jgi:hypothetical protein
LNINLNINNENQDCEKGGVWVGVLVGEGRMKEGDEGER